MRVDRQPYNPHTNTLKFCIFIDSYFEKYYTHFIEVTPHALISWKDSKLLTKYTRTYPRVFFYIPP
jgi:hypothetical protein